MVVEEVDSDRLGEKRRKEIKETAAEEDEDEEKEDKKEGRFRETDLRDN